MANRRMFARDVIESDEFLELSKEAQLLWFHLSMQADDDGLLNCSKRVSRLIDVGPEVLDELINTGFLLDCKNGIYALRDWKRCNTIKNDRYKKTVFETEFERLELVDNQYRFKVNEVVIPGMEPERNHVGSVVESSEYNLVQDNQVLGKGSLGDGSLKEEPQEGETLTTTLIPCDKCGAQCLATPGEFGGLRAYCDRCQRDFVVDANGEY